jgi:HEAT repeat protein/diketogulonate reductase-like aldo/keto reductase
MTLARLFASDPDVRLEALAHTAPTEDASWAVRDVLLGDEDATVRAAAAEWLGRARPSRSGPARALVDALYDTHPSVRMSACRALGRLRESSGAPVLRRLALEEPIWWVRRAAVVATARLDGDRAIPLLAAALDDPFWRVRNAAARALILAGARRPEELAAIVSDSERSDRARGALFYIAGKLGLARDALVGYGAWPAPEGALADADPAVVAARLERGLRATHAELVEYLGDPHEPLRRAASRRLAKSPDVRTLLAATLWLAEPRIPHAAATVVKLLDGLEGEAIDALLGTVLADPDLRPGAATWAISYIERSARGGRPLQEGDERLQQIHAAARATTAGVRRAAMAALGARLAHAPEDASACSALVDGLADDDDDVRRLAAFGLASSDCDAAWRALLERTGLADAPLVARQQAMAAAKACDFARLADASKATDPSTRAVALAALFEGGRLDSGTIEAARASCDPWTRGAVLDRDVALHVLERDPHPPLRRYAFACAVRSGLALDAARVAARSDDPWLRVRAAERLARSGQPGDEQLVYELLFDADAAVRCSAADATTHSPAVRERLAARAAEILATVPYRAGASSAPAEPRSRLGPLSSSVRDPGSRLDPLSSSVRDPVVSRANAPARVASPRPLGRIGLVVSPLAVSGANEPSVASLFRALDAGCNVFFWEPRYRNMTTFLRAAARRGRTPLVVAGTYHGTERAIVRDIDRARRALDRDRIGVFLVFWTRSRVRLEGEVPRALARAKRDGTIAAAGFSTHDRALAELTVADAACPWDVLMVRHSAAHPGAEDRLFSAAAARGVGVLGFSATCYGRLLRPVAGSPVPLPTAAECYRYSLSQPGVSACISAPRRAMELVENLAVLETPGLSEARMAELRLHGRAVREESLEFGRHLRRFPARPETDLDRLDQALADLDEEVVAGEVPFS